MRIILNAPGIHPHSKEAVEKELGELTARLKKVLFQFRPEEKTLRVHLAQQKSGAYRITMSVRMPGKNVIVERGGHNLIPLITEASKGLLDQVKDQTSVIRREHLRSKTAQQGEAVREAVSVPFLDQPLPREEDEEELRDRFTARLRLVLQDLHTHVVRLIRSSQLAGDLPPNYLKPGEVVNDVILRAYDIFRDRQGESEISPPVLYQLADKILLDEIRNCAENEESVVSMEQELPGTDQGWDVSDAGDEIVRSYQPEQRLLFEDVMPDAKLPDPVRALSEEEQMEQIFLRLSEESPNARSAFLLNRVEGFELYEISWIQERPEKDVLRDIRLCEERLRKAYSSPE